LPAVSTIALRELRDALHGRWLVGFGLLFALLTVFISYYGLAGAHEIGFQGFEQVAASLLNLVLFTVPLVALALPVASLTGEGDELSILLTQPVGRRTVLVGKYLGLVAACGLTLVGGLLAGGLVVLARAGGAYAGNFVLLAGLTFVLCCTFLALGTIIGVVWRERTRALGVGLALWFFLDVLYDLVVFGLTVSNPGIPLKALLIGALCLNPIDAVRVGYMLLTGSSSFVGVAGAVLAETLGSQGGLTALAVVLAGAPLAGLAIATQIFERRDY
jgi:Cu-processing system permease protein